MLGTYIGMRLVDVIMKKWNRQSFIVFTVSAIFAISTFLIPIFSSIDLLEQRDIGNLHKVFEIDWDGICT
jgi:hypothetical protein